MTRPLVIIGCGGMGREVHDIVDALNAVSPQWDMIGYLDDQPDPVNVDLVRARGSQVLGPVPTLRELDPQTSYVIGIGTGSVRRAIDAQVTPWGNEAAVLVHPTASMGFDVRLGAGTIVCAGVRLTTNIVLGRHVLLNLNVTVGHDSVLHDYVTVNPLTAISGWVTIGEGVLMGTHSAVLQMLQIGADATVGSGACVVKPVPPGVTVKGVPAK